MAVYEEIIRLALDTTQADEQLNEIVSRIESIKQDTEGLDLSTLQGEADKFAQSVESSVGKIATSITDIQAGIEGTVTALANVKAGFESISESAGTSSAATVKHVQEITGSLNMARVAATDLAREIRNIPAVPTVGPAVGVRETERGGRSAPPLAVAVGQERQRQYFGSIHDPDVARERWGSMLSERTGAEQEWEDLPVRGTRRNVEEEARALSDYIESERQVVQERPPSGADIAESMGYTVSGPRVYGTGTLGPIRGSRSLEAFEGLTASRLAEQMGYSVHEGRIYGTGEEGPIRGSRSLEEFAKERGLEGPITKARRPSVSTAEHPEFLAGSAELGKFAHWEGLDLLSEDELSSLSSLEPAIPERAAKYVSGVKRPESDPLTGGAPWSLEYVERKGSFGWDRVINVPTQEQALLHYGYQDPARSYFGHELGHAAVIGSRGFEGWDEYGFEDAWATLSSTIKSDPDTPDRQELMKYLESSGIMQQAEDVAKKTGADPGLYRPDFTWDFEPGATEPTMHTGPLTIMPTGSMAIHEVLADVASSVMSGIAPAGMDVESPLFKKLHGQVGRALGSIGQDFDPFAERGLPELSGEVESYFLDKFGIDISGMTGPGPSPGSRSFDHMPASEFMVREIIDTAGRGMRPSGSIGSMLSTDLTGFIGGIAGLGIDDSAEEARGIIESLYPSRERFKIPSYGGEEPRSLAALSEVVMGRRTEEGLAEEIEREKAGPPDRSGWTPDMWESYLRAENLRLHGIDELTESQSRQIRMLRGDWRRPAMWKASRPPGQGIGGDLPAGRDLTLESREMLHGPGYGILSDPQRDYVERMKGLGPGWGEAALGYHRQPRGLDVLSELDRAALEDVLPNIPDVALQSLGGFRRSRHFDYSPQDRTIGVPTEGDFLKEYIHDDYDIDSLRESFAHESAHHVISQYPEAFTDPWLTLSTALKSGPGSGDYENVVAYMKRAGNLLPNVYAAADYGETTRALVGPSGALGADRITPAGSRAINEILADELSVMLGGDPSELWEGGQGEVFDRLRGQLQESLGVLHTGAPDIDPQRRFTSFSWEPGLLHRLSMERVIGTGAEEGEERLETGFPGVFGRSTLFPKRHSRPSPREEALWYEEEFAAGGGRPPDDDLAEANRIEAERERELAETSRRLGIAYGPPKKDIQVAGVGAFTPDEYEEYKRVEGARKEAERAARYEEIGAYQSERRISELVEEPEIPTAAAPPSKPPDEPPPTQLSLLPPEDEEPPQKPPIFQRQGKWYYRQPGVRGGFSRGFETQEEAEQYYKYFGATDPQQFAAEQDLIREEFIQSITPEADLGRIYREGPLVRPYQQRPGGYQLGLPGLVPPGPEIPPAQQMPMLGLGELEPPPAWPSPPPSVVKPESMSWAAWNEAVKMGAADPNTQGFWDHYYSKTPIGRVPYERYVTAQRPSEGPPPPEWFTELDETDPTGGRGGRRGGVRGPTAEDAENANRFGGAIARTAGYFLRWLIVWNLFSFVTKSLKEMVMEALQIEEVARRVSLITGAPQPEATEYVMESQLAGAQLGIMPTEMRAALPGAAAYDIDPLYAAMARRAFGVDTTTAIQQLQSARYYTGYEPEQILDIASDLYKMRPVGSEEILQIISEAGLLSQMTGIQTEQMAYALTMTGRQMGTSPVQAATATQRLATRLPEYMTESYMEAWGGMERGDLAKTLVDFGIATERGGRQTQVMVEMIYQLSSAMGDTTGSIEDMVAALMEADVNKLQEAASAIRNAIAEIAKAAGLSEITGEIAEAITPTEEGKEIRERIGYGLGQQIRFMLGLGTDWQREAAERAIYRGEEGAGFEGTRGGRDVLAGAAYGKSWAELDERARQEFWAIGNLQMPESWPIPSMSPPGTPSLIEDLGQTLRKILGLPSDYENALEEYRTLLRRNYMELSDEEREKYYELPESERAYYLLTHRGVREGAPGEVGAPGEAGLTPAQMAMATQPAFLEFVGQPARGITGAARADITSEYFFGTIAPIMEQQFEERLNQTLSALDLTEKQEAGLREELTKELDRAGGIIRFADQTMYVGGAPHKWFQMAEQEGRTRQDFGWAMDYTRPQFERAWEQAGIETAAIEEQIGRKFEEREFVRAFKDGTAQYVGSNERLTRTMELLNDTLTGTWNIPAGQQPWIPLPTTYTLDQSRRGITGGVATSTAGVEVEDVEEQRVVQGMMAAPTGLPGPARGYEPGRGPDSTEEIPLAHKAYVPVVHTGISPTGPTGTAQNITFSPTINVDAEIICTIDGQKLVATINRINVNSLRQVGRSFRTNDIMME